MNRKITTICLFLVFFSFAQEKEIYHKKQLELKGNVKSFDYQYKNSYMENHDVYLFDKKGRVVELHEYSSNDTIFRKSAYSYNENDSVAEKKSFFFL